MNKSFCSLHDQEEEKYICIHPICLKKVDNKLCCIQCFSSNHKKIKLEQHQFINISELQQKALHNYQSLKINLNDEIQRNQQLNTVIEERLKDILLSLSTWQNNQKKMFNDIAQNSSHILTQNIIKADNLMKNPSLDTFIYFYKLNLYEKQKENQDIRDHSMRQLEYQLKQIEQKRDILVNQITFIQREHFLNFAQINYQIDFNFLKDYEFEKCEQHLSKKKMLCTHPNCLQEDQYQLQCVHCITEQHQEHQAEKYVKNIAQIQKEQIEKQQQIEQLKNKYSIDIKQSIDQNLLKINEYQQNYYQNYEKQKEKAVFLEQQQLNEFLNPETPIYIFDNIDSNLLKITKDQINFQYQQLYHNFEIKFSTIFLNQIKDPQQFCTELDFNSKQFFQYIFNLEQEFQIRGLKIEKQQKLIDYYASNQNKIESEMIAQTLKITDLQSNIENVIDSLSKLTQANSQQSFNTTQTLTSIIQPLTHILKSLTSISEIPTEIQKLNVENQISDLSKKIQSNSTSLNVLIHNLKSSLEEQITKLSKKIQENQIYQNSSIKNLKSDLEKEIESKLTQTNSSQNVSIGNLQSNIEKANSTLNQLTQTNSQSQKQTLDVMSQLNTTLNKQVNEVTSLQCCSVIIIILIFFILIGVINLKK